jgi:citrate synthase
MPRRVSPRVSKGSWRVESAICSVEQGKLIYRGYEIHDLAANATFEEVAFVLLEGHKPSAAELSRFKAEVVAERAIPASIVQFLKDAGPALKKGRRSRWMCCGAR